MPSTFLILFHVTSTVLFYQSIKVYYFWDDLTPEEHKEMKMRYEQQSLPHILFLISEMPRVKKEREVAKYVKETRERLDKIAEEAQKNRKGRDRYL